MILKNIVFDTRGDMIAFVGDAVGIHCVNAGIDVEFGVDINLLLDFINRREKGEMLRIQGKRAV